MGLKVRNDRAALGPLFLGLQMHDAVGHVEFGTEAPFVFLAEVGWEGLLDDLTNGVVRVLRKRSK